MDFDLVIRGGTVVDGSGGSAQRGDVAVQAGRVAAVGHIKGSAARTLNAEGLVVAPGFVDMHTHYDCQLLWDPAATSSCWHGVTTVLIGNCGYTIAPKRPSDTDYLMRFMAVVEGIPAAVLRSGPEWPWESFGEYLRTLGMGLGVNVAAQVGHSALRYYVMGQESCERPATGEELSRMKGILRQAMADGAIGFSTLQSLHQRGVDGTRVPSQLCTEEELAELCGVVGEFGRGVMTANPRPGAGVIDEGFQDFMARVSRSTGKPFVWNQFFHTAAQPDHWRELLQYMDRVASQGARVYTVARCQRMDTEFNLRRTSMFDGAPSWKETLWKSHEEKKRLLLDPACRAKLRKEWDGSMGRRLPSLQVGRVKLQKNKALEGKRVTDLAEAQGKPPLDYVLDLSLEEDLDTQFVFVGTANADPVAVEQITKGPYCLAGASDAGAHLDNDCGVDFTGVLLGHWVRDRGVMSLEEGVRRLTSMSANILGLENRGLLREGMAADIVVFDPSTIGVQPREIAHDLPGGGPRIIQRAQGVETVIVNGQVLIQDNRHTGALPGKVLGKTGQ